MKCLIFFICISCAQLAHAQLSAGDIAFVGFDTDSDNLAFIALVDIPANTTIYFSDNEWNELPIGSGGALGTGEGQITWTTNSSLEAGEVIELTNLSSPSSINASLGSISRSSGNFDQANTNETVYCYLGSNDQSPIVFLTAYSNKSFLNATVGTLINTGLTAGTSALSIAGDEDIGVYSGDNICNGTVVECATMINTPANWITDDGSGSQSADGISPDWIEVQLIFGGLLLPVTWLYVKATQKDLNSVSVEWATASELNNDHFELEQSYDGEHFILVNTIAGNGTTSEKHEYAASLPMSTQTSWIRIKQVDTDGKYEYSETIRLMGSQSDETVFPNPNSGHITINTPMEYYDILIFDNQGILCFMRNGLSQVSRLEINHLPAGCYHLKLISNGEYYTHTLIKH